MSMTKKDAMAAFDLCKMVLSKIPIGHTLSGIYNLTQVPSQQRQWLLSWGRAHGVTFKVYSRWEKGLNKQFSVGQSYVCMHKQSVTTNWTGLHQLILLLFALLQYKYYVLNPYIFGCGVSMWIRHWHGWSCPQPSPQMACELVIQSI